MLRQRENYINVESSEENTAPNITKNLEPPQSHKVFKDIISPENARYSSSKRYKDHFNAEEKQNDEFSENDILYEICDNEKRPSKDVTTNNTGLSTMRENTKVVQEEIGTNESNSPNYSKGNHIFKYNKPSQEVKITDTNLKDKSLVSTKEVNNKTLKGEYPVNPHEESFDQMAD